MILTFFIVNFSLIGLYMYITALGVASVLKSIFGGSNYSTNTTAVANSTATSIDPWIFINSIGHAIYGYCNGLHWWIYRNIC